MRTIVPMVGLSFFWLFSLTFAAHGVADDLPGTGRFEGRSGTGTEIVFIDPSVMDADEIIDDLGKNAEVVRLTPGRDGIEEISDCLCGRRNIAAIRIIAHGNPGYFVLNGEMVHSPFVTDNADRIMAWGNALAEGADILLYGCNVAANARGQALVAQIANLTGANVAAASSPVGGNIDSSGNWDLEYHYGTIESTALNIHGYPFHLANQIVTSNSDSGAGSLRDAIANVGPGEEITFNLSSGYETITLTSGQLTINKALTIDGVNAAGSGINITIDGDNSSRVFEVLDGPVTLQNMIIENGHVSTQNGGAVYVSNSTLTVTNSSINSSTAGLGGGLYASSSTVALTNSTISGNTASSVGGGIGALANSTLTLTDSTVSGNSTGGSGGGGGVYASSSTVALTNSTISGNTASNGGCGIFVSNDSTLTLTNSIVAYNYRSDFTAYIDIGNDSGATIQGNYNIVGYPISSGTGNQQYTYTNGEEDTLFASYDEIIVDTIYEPVLADNGGSTQTIALASGSIAENPGVRTGFYDDSGTTKWAFFNGTNWVKVEDVTADATGVTEITTDQRSAARYASLPSIGAFYPDQLYYRTKVHGTWSTVSNWEVSTDGISWAEATVSPHAYNSISISINHDMTVDADVTIDQTTIEFGATLIVNTGQILTIADGVGTDLTVTGTLTNLGTIACDAYSNVMYDGTTDQNIVEAVYNELALSGSGTKTFSGTTTAYDGIVVSSSLTLAGDGSSTTIVQAHVTSGLATRRVFTIQAGNTVTISDMTVRYGKTDNGGGIYNEGILTVAHCMVSDNLATSMGGGIYNNGTLAVTDCMVSYNLTTNVGGGIYNHTAFVTIMDSTFSGNQAAYGGGIYNDGTISSISNSTISGNQATFYGGGIFAGTASMAITNSTVANNRSDNDDSGGEQGGGIFLYSGALSVRNTILANNYRGSGTGTGDDYYYNGGTLTDNEYNVAEYQNGTSTGSGKTFNATTDIFYNTKADGTTGYSTWNQNNADLANQNLSLAATLADNGGPTQTLALEAGSFAIGAIPYADAGSGVWNGSPTTGGNYYDQRGAETPAGALISIGAYSEPAEPPTHVDLTGPPTILKGSVSGPFTLTSLDASEEPANVDQDTVFDLSSNSTGTVTFYSDAAGTTSITQVTIPNGQSTATFYYLDTTFGTPTITATRASGMVLGNDSKQIRVTSTLVPVYYLLNEEDRGRRR